MSVDSSTEDSSSSLPSVSVCTNQVTDVVSAAAPAVPVSHTRPVSTRKLLDKLSRRTAEQREAMLLAEMERRGKTAPSTVEQRTDLITQEHLRGHFGRDVIYRQLNDKGYWWPGMREDILVHIRDCIPCLRFNIGKQGFAPAIPITAELPFDHIQLDTATSLPPSRESIYSITCYY